MSKSLKNRAENATQAQLLCSPDEADQWRGLELVEALLESDPKAIDIPALVLLAFVGAERDPEDFSDVRKKARSQLERLPKPPKDLGGVFDRRYVKYICEHGSSEVITRMIELSREDRWHDEDEALRWDFTRLSELPRELAQFTDVPEFYMPMARLTQFPEVLLDMPWLRSIDFSSSKITSLPPQIARLEHLESLRLERNALSDLPDEIGALQCLEWLFLSHNKLTELPESMAQLTSLRSLRLEANPMNSPGQVERLFEAFHENRTDIEARRIQINLIFARNARACELADVQGLIDALDTPFTLVRGNARIALDMKLESAYREAPLQAGVRLAVVGKCGLSAREIKSRLEEYDIGVGGTIKKDTTHVLLGERPGKKRETLRDFKGVFLTESFLTEFLHAQDTPLFLDAEQDTREVQTNIVDLLMSEDKENQVLALEMLKGTGVSRELMTPLYLAYRLAKDKKARDAAKALLLQNASPGFAQIINKNQNFKTASEKAADKYFKVLADYEEIDVLQLARLYSRRHHVGLNFVFEHGDPSEFAALLAGMVDAAGTLDLHERGLRLLPEEIGKVQAITHLRLSHNLLTVLPESLGELKRLEEIDVSANKLTTLPESLGTLAKLARLNVSRNRLTRLPATLGEAPLVGLDVCNNKLTALPASLDDSARLEQLNVNRNKLKDIPKGLGALKMLYATDNRIGVFPEALLDCRHLHELHIEENTITQWPRDLSVLSELEFLHFGWDTLDVPPPQIATLPALERLTVYSESLEDLPPVWAGLSALKVLSLWGCGLAGLPACIPKLMRLEHLNLRGNRFTDLPDALAELTRLRDLDVSNNDFKDFPEVLLRMNWLDELDIKGGGSFKLPDDLARMSKLTALWVDYEMQDRARQLMPLSCNIF